VTKVGVSNIEFVHIENSNSQDYATNFSNIDCYVSLSKGEGFAIQPREAMALGIPVIVTNNTAQSTLCKSGLVRSVDANIPEPADFFDGESAGDFFNCRLDDAKEALLDVYNNYDKYLKSAEAARKWAEQYSSTSLRALYLSLIKPKTVVFGENNVVTPDYLETNSKELYEKYQRLIP
jgi:glycosyltransferase involved in cell wall biosynthesis